MKCKFISYLSITILMIFVLTGCGANDGANEDIGNEENIIEETVDENNSAIEERDTDETIALGDIQEFELEIVLANNEEIDIDYKNKATGLTAEVERKTTAGKEEIKGDEAIKEIETLLQQISLQPETNPEEAIEQILTTMNISRDEVKKLELEVDFITGEKIKGRL